MPARLTFASIPYRGPAMAPYRDVAGLALFPPPFTFRSYQDLPRLIRGMAKFHIFPGFYESLLAQIPLLDGKALPALFPLDTSGPPVLREVPPNVTDFALNYWLGQTISLVVPNRTPRSTQSSQDYGSIDSSQQAELDRQTQSSPA